jgi:hypothetical protein
MLFLDIHYQRTDNMFLLIFWFLMQRFVSRRFCVYILPESHHRASPLSSGIIVIPIADSPLANDDSGKAVKMLFHKRNDACILYTNPSFYCDI